MKEKIKFSKKLIDQLLKNNKCSNYRVLDQEDMYTSDFIEDRLNILKNQEDEIVEMWVG